MQGIGRGSHQRAKQNLKDMEMESDSSKRLTPLKLPLQEMSVKIYTNTFTVQVEELC
jgi:hypothetical protein